MNKICGIYKITSPTDKIYIGQSVDIRTRLSRYKKLSNIKKQYKIYNSILKYGWESHMFEIICECEKSELNELEKHYIKYYNSFDGDHGMNLTEGGNNNGKCSEETRQRMSDAKKGNKNMLGYRHTDESKLKMKLGNTGKIHSNETKLKMSINHKGRIVSDETRKKISIGHKDKVISDETKEKLRKINLGKKASEETKAKLRNSFKNGRITDELRKKLSNNFKGKTHTEEAKQKIGEYHIGNKHRLGTKHSDESKLKMSLSARKRICKNTIEIL